MFDGTPLTGPVQTVWPLQPWPYHFIPEAKLNLKDHAWLLRTAKVYKSSTNFYLFIITLPIILSNYFFYCLQQNEVVLNPIPAVVLSRHDDTVQLLAPACAAAANARDLHC